MELQVTTIEARITEALTEHSEVRIFGPRCRCGMPLDNGERYAVLAAHQAAVVAGIVAEAMAEVWDHGRWTGSGLSVASAILRPNPYRKDTQ